jgi:hypothetical protein
MNQGTTPEELTVVVDDVARVVGTEVTVVGRLPGGVHAGAIRVRPAGRADAVLTAEPPAHPHHRDERLRALRINQRRRRRDQRTEVERGGPVVRRTTSAGARICSRSPMVP